MLVVLCLRSDVLWLSDSLQGELECWGVLWLAVG